MHIQLQLQSPYIITYCDYGRGARIHYKSWLIFIIGYAKPK